MINNRENGKGKNCVVKGDGRSEEKWTKTKGGVNGMIDKRETENRAECKAIKSV